MIRISVVHSASLAETFDRQRYATDLHSALCALTGMPVSDFVTHFQQAEEIVAGDGASSHPRVYVEIAAHGRGTGRSAKKIPEVALTQLRAHLRGGEERVHIAAEYRLNQYGFFAEDRC